MDPQDELLTRFEQFKKQAADAGLQRANEPLQDIPPLPSAVLRSDAAALGELLGTHSANETWQGKPLLRLAASISSREVIQQLLEHGAEVNGGDKWGDTPLMAAPHRDVDTVAALLAAGADVNARNAFGCTALHYAVRVGSPDIVELLLRHGASVTAITAEGETPLGDATDRGEQAIISLLCRYGAAPVPEEDR